MSRDNNYQFAEIASLRERGVRTIGRFVWEHFAPEHAHRRRATHTTSVYSFTRAEQERYAEMGIESPYVPWGVHPELLDRWPGRSSHDAGVVRFVVPGSFMGKRKPFAEIADAFSRVEAPPTAAARAGAGRAQARSRSAAPVTATHGSRSSCRTGRPPSTCASSRPATLRLSPSRWEGLGLPLYEAIAFGMPTITNDAPPMNEVVLDGVNGICVRSVPWGEAGSGIPAFDPDFDQLTAAIERLGDAGERERLARGAIELREGERSWDRTVEGLSELLR